MTLCALRKKWWIARAHYISAEISAHRFCRDLHISAEISRKANLHGHVYFQKNF